MKGKTRKSMILAGTVVVLALFLTGCPPSPGPGHGGGGAHVVITVTGLAAYNGWEAWLSVVRSMETYEGGMSDDDETVVANGSAIFRMFNEGGADTGLPFTATGPHYVMIQFERWPQYAFYLSNTRHNITGGAQTIAFNTRDFSQLQW